MKTMNLLRQPELIAVETQEGWKTLPQKGGDGIVVAYTPVEEGMQVTLHAPDIRVRHILLQWKETPQEGCRILGDHWERAYGDLAWRGIEPHRELPWYFFVSDGQTLDGYGVLTGGAAFASWYLDGNVVSLLLDVRCGNRGVLLGQRELQAAIVTLYKGEEKETVFSSAAEFCRRMCPSPRLPKEPVYGGNNWYYAYGNCSSASFLQDCRIMAELSEGLPVRPFMVLDDGWQVSHGCYQDCTQDAWKPDPVRFPDMKKMAEAAKEMGVKPGIWYRPLIATKASREDWMMPQKKDGSKSYKLDPSRTEVLEKIGQEIRQLKEWGFELIKHDFTSFDILGVWGAKRHSMAPEEEWHFFDETKTTAEIIKQLYEMIRKSAGDIPVIGCNTISHLAAGIFEMQRTGDDVSGCQWERTRKMGVNALAFRMPQHETFYAADADCVGITGQIPWSLNRQWLDLLANSGTPLFVSLDPAAASLQVRKDIRQAFQKAAVRQRRAWPLDWMDTALPRRWSCETGEKEYCWSLPGKIEFCEGYIGE